MKVLGLNFRKASSKYGTLLDEKEEVGEKEQLRLPLAAVTPVTPKEVPNQTTREISGMTPKSAGLALQLHGDWVQVKSGNRMATISGMSLTWYNGHVSTLEFSRGQICMHFQGKHYQAELGGDGVLRWSDGDVWIQRTQGNSPHHASEGLLQMRI